MAIDHSSQIVNTLLAHADGNIQKHVTNIKILMSNGVGVAEHPDHLETIEKELKVIAEYDDQLEMLKKYFTHKDPFKS